MFALCHLCGCLSKGCPPVGTVASRHDPPGPSVVSSRALFHRSIDVRAHPGGGISALLTTQPVATPPSEHPAWLCPYLAHFPPSIICRCTVLQTSRTPKDPTQKIRISVRACVGRMVDVQWTALAPWEDQTPSPRPLAEDLLARERVLTVDAQRMSLEIDTAVGTAPEAQSSGTPSSADTMRSADTPSSTTDDDLIPLDDDEDDDSEMKEEPEPTSPADHGLDAAMQDEATSPISPAEHNPTTTGAARRPRGRPRRTMSSPVVKVAHPRSKTGCMTCRKRKKKCDERRPECWCPPAV